MELSPRLPGLFRIGPSCAVMLSEIPGRIIRYIALNTKYMYISLLWPPLDGCHGTMAGCARCRFRSLKLAILIALIVLQSIVADQIRHLTPPRSKRRLSNPMQPLPSPLRRVTATVHEPARPVPGQAPADGGTMRVWRGFMAQHSVPVASRTQPCQLATTQRGDHKAGGWGSNSAGSPSTTGVSHTSWYRRMYWACVATYPAMCPPI